MDDRSAKKPRATAGGLLMVPYPRREGTETGPRVEFVALVFGQIYVFESYSDETATWTGTEGLPIYPVEMPPTADTGILKKGAKEETKAQRRELHFLPLKSLKSAPHIAKPLFSRRLEGGQAQRHRQKWKLKRQKKGLS